jgi:hypothetical protein
LHPCLFSFLMPISNLLFLFLQSLWPFSKVTAVLQSFFITQVTAEAKEACPSRLQETATLQVSAVLLARPQYLPHPTPLKAELLSDSFGAMPMGRAALYAASHTPLPGRQSIGWPVTCSLCYSRHKKIGWVNHSSLRTCD